MPKKSLFLKSIYISIILEYVCKTPGFFGAFGIWHLFIYCIKVSLKEYKHIILIISINNIMQQYIIHLNGGFNPFARLGRGALGFRPLRKMIGRGGDDDNGGSEGNPSKETVQKNITSNYQMFTDTGNTVYFDNAQENERLLAIIEAIEQKEAVKKAQEEEAQEEETKTEDLKAINFEDDINSLFKSITKNVNKKIEDKNINSEYNTLNSDLIKLIDIIKNKDVGFDHKRGLLTKSYINAIESINAFITNNNINNSIDKHANALINDWLSELNAPTFYKDGRTYKLEENKVVKYDKAKQEGPLGFAYNRTITDVNNEVKAYWNNNIKTVLDPTKYGEEFNDMIKEINKSVLIEDRYSGDDYEKSSEIKNQIPDKELSYNYMKDITINGKSKFYNEDRTPIMSTMSNKVIKDGIEIKEKKEVELIYKEYISSGKPAEFSICGKKNPIAKQIYGVANPNIQNADYIVENILVSQGKKGGSSKQFCIDNIDTTNKFFSEMKDYKDKFTYRTHYKANIELKKMYINMLKENLRVNIEAFLKEKKNKKINKKNLEELNHNINTLYKVLSNKKEFEKDFYKNIRYLGIGVTMNKFNKIIIPKNYKFDDSPSPQDEILHVKESQGQLFIPHMKNRKIVKITSADGDTDFDTAFNETINISKTNPYTFMITVVLADGVCVYNYTMDDLVENDFILGTYKCAYAADTHKHEKYNAVLIPFEKLDLIFESLI